MAHIADSMLFFKLLLSLAAFWHTLAFAAGGVYVFHAYRALFHTDHKVTGSQIIRSADWQLWASGFAIIGLGIALSGFEQFLGNPKLLAKATVVCLWFVATQAMRRLALPKFRRGERTPMLLASSISAACWSYGAFLGVAKPLAFGIVSYWALLTGFGATITMFVMMTLYYEKRRSNAH